MREEGTVQCVNSHFIPFLGQQDVVICLFTTPQIDTAVCRLRRRQQRASLLVALQSSCDQLHVTLNAVETAAPHLCLWHISHVVVLGGGRLYTDLEFSAFFSFQDVSSTYVSLYSVW